MTITTEEAEALAESICGASEMERAAAANAIRTLAAERDKLSKALAGALANLADASRARGEAEGKLAASEMAGVVQGWQERAERAEAEAERLREALSKLVREVSHDASLAIAQGPAHKPRLAAAYDAARAALEGGDNADQKAR